LILCASLSENAIARWNRGLSGLAPVSCVTNLDILKGELRRVGPQILLLDYDFPGLDGARGLSDLISLSPETRIVILSPVLSDEAERDLFRVGVRGCCLKDIDAKQLRNVVLAVLQGELWIRRTLTCHLLEELGVIVRKKNQIKQATSNLLMNLTQRESEIATLIGSGESNKQIAQRLSITERTVKAHLTEIFRKLEVADRLKLSLIVNGSGRAHEQA
jgi:DNA-binding NarL/FixJ family response regulator